MQILAIFPAYHLRFPPVFRKILELFSVFNFNFELVGNTGLCMAFMHAVQPSSACLLSSTGANAIWHAGAPRMRSGMVLAQEVPDQSGGPVDHCRPAHRSHPCQALALCHGALSGYVSLLKTLPWQNCPCCMSRPGPLLLS